MNDDQLQDVDFVVAGHLGNIYKEVSTRKHNLECSSGHSKMPEAQAMTGR